jgi:starch phosphorylase
VNLSILDGWWVEGYRGDNGWAIGPDTTTPDPDAQDRQDAESLYALLEQQVVPCFFDKDPDGVRRKWVSIMKASIQSCVLPFSAHRMVRDYAEKMYLPLAGARKG